MDNILVKFNAYLASSKKLTENTLASYRRDVEKYCAYLKENGYSSFDVKQPVLIAYLLHLQKDGLRASTVSRNLASLRSFYNFLYTNGITSTDPTINLESPKVEKKLPQILTPQEVEQLLEQPKCIDLKGYRDKAMLELLYATGIRVSELIGLNLTDVDVKAGMLKCCSSRPREIPLGSAAIEAIEEYLSKARPLLIKSGEEKALFVNYSGTRLTRQGFWKIIKQYQAQANIKKQITPQTLRHSFAVHLLSNGAPLSDIAEMLGHSDIASTQVYRTLAKNRLKEAYKKAHPRA